MIKVGGIQNTQVLWQAVFLAASPLAYGGSAAKILFRARLQYRQLRRLGFMGVEGAVTVVESPRLAGKLTSG